MVTIQRFEKKREMGLKNAKCKMQNANLREKVFSILNFSI
jgi:hypothetical protein